MLFFFIFCFPLKYCTLFHVSIPLGLSVAYNICMYIICPWWRKRTKNRKKNTDKKITYCHASQCGFEKARQCSCTGGFWKKKNTSKHRMLCSGLWLMGPDGGEFRQYDLKSWIGDKQNVSICTNKQQKNMFSWVMMYVNESHFWSEWGGLERVWARRQQIPWVYNLRVEEDAVERESTRSDGPVGGYPDNANPEAESQGEMGWH